MQAHYRLTHTGVPIPDEFRRQNPESPTLRTKGKAPAGAGAAAAVESMPRVEEQETKEGQFKAVLRNIGIADKAAHSVAWFVVNNYDPDDPEQLKVALQQLSSLTPADRRQIWLSWTNRVHPGLSNDYKQRVQGAFSDELVAIGGSADAADGKDEQRVGLEKRIWGITGGIVMKDPEQGLTYHEASALAMQQQRAMAGGQQQQIPWDSMFRTMAEAKERPDNLKPILETLQTFQPKPDDGKMVIELVNTKIEAQGSAFRQTLELIQAQHKAEMELMREQSRNQLDKLSETMGDIASALKDQRSSRDPFEPLEQVLPGAKQRLVDMLWGNGKQDDRVVIKVGEGEMTLDAYERLENIKNRREMGAAVRQALPQFMEYGKDIATALSRINRSSETMEQVYSSPVDTELVHKNCAGCGTEVILDLAKVRGKAWRCRSCGTTQDTEGQVLRLLPTTKETSADATLESKSALTPQEPELPPPSQDDIRPKSQQAEPELIAA